MSKYVDFHYTPLEGKISGEQVLRQTEDAINDLGKHVYEIDIDNELVQQAINDSQEAKDVAESALSVVTTNRAVWFNNVADMVEAEMDAGIVAATKGYYLPNDGGHAFYSIRTKKSGDVDDGGSVIFLDDDEIVAELFTDGVVNVKQFGAVGDGVEDDTTAFQNTSAFASTNSQVAMITPATYKVTDTISGTFGTVGTVTITGGGTVDIVNFKDEVDIASASADLAKKWANYMNGVVADGEYSAKKYATDASTSATNASASATNAQNLYNALIAQGGYPFQAATVSAMTDQTKIYVYVGSETGYTYGDWYYYNGSAWVSGGVYNAIVLETDKTLSISGDAADAKVTGNSLKLSSHAETVTGKVVEIEKALPNASITTNATHIFRSKRNMIQIDDGVYSSTSNLSITFTNGVGIVSGSAGSTAHNITLFKLGDLVQGVSYSLWGLGAGLGSGVGYIRITSDGGPINYTKTDGTPHTFTAGANTKNCYVVFRTVANTTYNNLIIVPVMDESANCQYVTDISNLTLLTGDNVVANVDNEDITINYNSVATDDTLTIEGIPADAKATGDRLQNDEEILQNLQNSIGEIDVPITTTVIGGKYWNSQTSTAVLTTYASYGYVAPIEVVEGKEYEIYMYSPSSTKTHAVLVVDEDYLILQKFRGSKTDWNTFKFVPAEGAKYILLTVDGSHQTINAKYKTTPSLIDLYADVDKIKEVAYFDGSGKTVAILSDSIGTNGNYSVSNPLGNVPEIVVTEDDIGVALSAYATYYDIGTTIGGHTITADDVGTEITFTPVAGDEGKMVGVPNNNNSASIKVWWEVAMEELGFTPIPVCWSGSSITSHEGNTDILKTSYAWHPAQIRKCGIRTAGTMTRTAPDIIIIARGTNDFSHTPYTRLTEGYFDQYPCTIPATDYDSVNQTYGFIEGLCITIQKLKEAYPKALIYLATQNFIKRVVYSSFPTRNTINTLPQFNNAIRATADYFGLPIIDFAKDGLDFWNASNEYYQDSTAYTHPTTKGHAVMAQRAIKDIVNGWIDINI